MKFRPASILALGMVVLLAVACSGPSTPATPATPATPTTAPAKAPTAQTSAVPTSSTSKSGGTVARMKSPEAGVQVFLWGSPTVDRDLKLAKGAGFTWIKQMFQGDYIEGAGKGKFAWNEPDRLVKAANQAGLKIIARVDWTPAWARPQGAPKTGAWNGPPTDLNDFGDFVNALVSRYKTGSPNGHIDAFEIWNEPNLAREWGGRPPNAAEYVQMLKVAYLAAKKADPSSVIISAGLSPTGTVSPDARPDDLYLDEMYQAGAKDYFDVLGVNAPGYKAPPEMSPAEVASNKDYGGQRFFCFRHVEDMRQIMVKYGDEKKQVAVLEMGWTTDNRPGSPYAWHAVTEQQKGDYIVGAYQYAQKNWSDWIGLMSTIYISDPHWTVNDEQFYWSLTDPDGTPRPSYNIIKGKLPQ